MYQQVITPPAAEPILLAEFKDHLRLSGSDEDAALGAHITAARVLIENHTDIALVDRQIHLFLDRWHAEQRPSCAMFLPVRPVRAITSIAVLDAQDTETLWPADNYILSPGFTPKISLHSGRRWPVPTKSADGIKITLTVGFGPDWNHVPASVRQAVLMTASYLYANRGDVSAGSEGGPVKAAGADSLLIPYRQRRL